MRGVATGIRFTLLGFALAGCADEPAEAPCEPYPYGPSQPADDALSESRESCEFAADRMTAETVAAETPGIEKLEHVIVLMMENRSFDHYFSGLPDAGVHDVTVASNQSNPTGCGSELERYRETRLCVKSPGHEWNDSHVQYAAGRLDGFITSSNPGGGRAMGYYTEEDLKFYYYLAKTFAISDRNFSSLLGPTQPNRLFLWLGTSCGFAEGFVTNPAIINTCGSKRRSILDQLNDAGYSYDVYDHSGFSTLILGLGVYPGVPKSIATFEQHVQTDSLPTLSFVGASTGEFLAPDGNDDHPPFNPQLGQRFVARILDALRKNLTVWNKTALIITYDEHGGYYDHVPPPRACDPEPLPDRDYEFDQYGFRVPLIVVSPFARAKYVSHVDTDHTSILRFIQHWLGLPSLTRRDANAWPLFDLFDFNQTPLPPPSWDPSLIALSTEGQARCQMFPDGESGVPGDPQNCSSTP